ncbi:hypothetical protein DE146DRAFT_623313 [Phaeosphaeria sp. MPI-PUGE-AT-0046c]|nr:hypothetical protein DE146DRAFT_623313 [Phaeosphaeria sp. MPI-PUGE-AT-0046c]
MTLESTRSRRSLPAQGVQISDSEAGEGQGEQRQEDDQGGQQQVVGLDAEGRHGNNNWYIRRILAQKSSSTLKKEYLVEYFPTWETEANLKQQMKALKVWETNKQKGYTFEFEDRFVTKQIVLKATNPTTDDDPKLSRQMFDTVMHQLRKFLHRRGLADTLFKTNEWAFATDKERNWAIVQAEKAGQAPPCAAQVMQSTVDEINKGVRRRYTIYQMLHDVRHHLTYGTTKVQFFGQIDENIREPAPQDERNYGTVISFLRPLYDLIQQDLDSVPWETPQLHSNLAALAKIVDRVVRKSPFLLKREYVWPLFFVRFFLFSDHIKLKLNPELKSPNDPNSKSQKYEMSEDWNEETRDWFLQAYSVKALGRWDSRPLEYIERTYIQCRDGVMERVQDAEKLAAGEEVAGDWADENGTNADEGADSDTGGIDADDEEEDYEYVQQESESDYMEES